MKSPPIDIIKQTSKHALYRVDNSEENPTWTVANEIKVFPGRMCQDLGILPENVKTFAIEKIRKGITVKVTY